MEIEFLGPIEFRLLPIAQLTSRGTERTCKPLIKEPVAYPLGTVGASRKASFTYITAYCVGRCKGHRSDVSLNTLPDLP